MDRLEKTASLRAAAKPRSLLPRASPRRPQRCRQTPAPLEYIPSFPEFVQCVSNDGHGPAHTIFLAQLGAQTLQAAAHVMRCLREVEGMRQRGRRAATERDRRRTEAAGGQPASPESLVKEEWEDDRRDTGTQSSCRGSSATVVNDGGHPRENGVVRDVIGDKNIGVAFHGPVLVATPAGKYDSPPPGAREYIRGGVEDAGNATAAHAAEAETDGGTCSEKLFEVIGQGRRR